MRGTVAKRLRRAIYGENFSPRERRYEWIKHDVRRVNAKGELISHHPAYQVVNTGRRAEYQRMKKAVLA